MARLSQHVSNLNESILKLLEKKNIFTVLDFLEEDPDKMCNLSGLSFKDVIDIRRKLISKCAVKPDTGLDVYSNMLLKAAKISTGIECLDEILEGGILTGNICEVCGLSGEGKTQICFTVICNIILNLKQIVYFVDTKHDFSATYIQSMIKAQHYNDMEIQSAMEKIKVTKLNDIYQLINFLHELETVLVDNPCRIIIIDSLPVLFAPFINANNNDGLGLINHIATTMKYISTKFQVVFLVVNIAMMSFDMSDDVEIQTRSGNNSSEISFMGDLKPGLGKVWHHVPSYRLLIKKDSSLPSSQRVIVLVKSTDLPSGKSCVVEITDKGVISVLI
ncbi:rad51 recombinase D [Lycorma delicatula]|uniref:rad51 recombinase D n=1 Tax=Lycorma delicatula TaxID=130591 RepID=UPI003F5158EC